MFRLTPLAVSCLAALCLAGPARAETPARLLLHPGGIELDGPGARHQVLVSTVAPDGRLTDVTTQASFASSAPGVVSVSASGECRAGAAGVATITARYMGRSAAVAVRVTGAAGRRAPSFLNDVMPLFTRFGCNQGACHGKGAGQNGFRLSLRGYAPELDHDWLTREFNGRRVNLAAPEQSLVLRKPLGLAAHEGGKLFSIGSPVHRTLLDWIRAGAPGPAASDPSCTELEILPGNRRCRVGQEQQLLVRARYSDGRWRDVTWLSKFDSNDPGVAEVDAGGLVRLRRHGETSIRAAFQGQVAVVVLTVPYDRPPSPPGAQPQQLVQGNNFIDGYVFTKLGELGIEPSDLCGDGEFLRRAMLDTVGVLPTPAEVRAFLADARPDKRTRLVDRLLARPEFVDYWALQLDDLFQNRRERDHDVRGAKGVQAFHDWLRRQVAANRPWDRLARDVLTASGKASDNPAVGYFIVTVGEHNDPEHSEVVDSVAQAFLGTRIGCARCHNHPLERYTQDDYYRFAGFFARVHLQRREPKKGPTTLLVAGPDGKPAKGPSGVVQPRTGQFLAPLPLDRSPMTLRPEEDPRVRLADWMTAPHNEAFSGAMVNRLWKHFLGVGLVEPVDDLRASNPPSNPALWQALSREFVGHGFDLRHLMALILNSRTYQLSSATRPAGPRNGEQSDSRFYSHYYARRLPAEVLLDALSQGTGVPDRFPGYPAGTRAGQLPDPALKSYFLSLFGRPERVTACACERSGEVTMPQLLHLQNGASVVQKVDSADGRLTRLLRAGKSDTEVVDELFLATLSRVPSAAERAAVQGALVDANREEAFRDLFWALLNSKEFTFNH